MKRYFFALLAGLAVSVFLVSSPTSAAENSGTVGGKIVVANRNSGSISVIDTDSDTVLGTFALPGPNPAEPMYVIYHRAGNRVFVGDRANDQVAVFNGDSFSLEATVPTGEGVFHMWAQPNGRQLWVNNDIDNTATVIDPRTLDIIATVPMPADLVAAGGKPHDVIVDPEGRFAFVTMLGFAGDHDYVVQFSTGTFEEVNRAQVGKDPHVSLTQRNRYLYVPAQNSDVISVFDRVSLEPVTEIEVDGAHGAGMRRDGRYFYTTNLPGGGVDGLVAIDTQSNTVLGAVNTPEPVPHNIALTARGEKIYVTHSGGTATTVSVYTASNMMPVPVLLTEVIVGLNPFGIAYVP